MRRTFSTVKELISYVLTDALRRSDVGSTASSADEEAGTPDQMVGSLWIGCYLPSDVAGSVALIGQEPAESLHMTLAMFNDITEEQANAVVAVLSDFCKTQAPLKGSIKGYGRFLADANSSGKDVVYASFDSPTLPAFREGMVRAACTCEGVEYPSQYGFIPHITLAYIDPRQSVPVEDIKTSSLSFDAIICSYDHNIIAAIPMLDSSIATYKMEALQKSEDRRYTFGVVYKASNDLSNPEVDAHGEFISPQELQDAQWRYVQSGNRTIFVQHGLDKNIGYRPAGEWVDICMLPFEYSAELTLPDGKVRRSVIPANSVYMGVLWNEEFWPYVKSGQIRGYSFGGFARRIPADEVM